MLIPSIDLQGGRIVQLVQGERLAVETSDIDAWILKLSGQPKVQLIDLDAAKGAGDNAQLVARICRELPCRVGGGIRSVERARELLRLGATAVIAGSALFTDRGVDVAFVRLLSEAVGAGRLIAAIDCRGGKVVIHGWRTQLPYGPAEAMQALDPFVSEYLFTNVDREGLMQGTGSGRYLGDPSHDDARRHGGGRNHHDGRGECARRDGRRCRRGNGAVYGEDRVRR